MPYYVTAPRVGEALAFLSPSRGFRSEKFLQDGAARAWEWVLFAVRFSEIAFSRQITILMVQLQSRGKN